MQFYVQKALWSFVFILRAERFLFPPIEKEKDLILSALRAQLTILNVALHDFPDHNIIQPDR